MKTELLLRLAYYIYFVEMNARVNLKFLAKLWFYLFTCFVYIASSSLESDM